MKSKKTAVALKEVMDLLNVELTTWIDKGNKSSAKRARKLTLEFEKIGKQFRKESVADSNGSEV